jgi:competence protein ComEA
LSGWQSKTIPAESANPQPPSAGRIDLNTATQEELESLPGIGPKLAEDILRYRTGKPFVRVDDLTEVSGIGEKRLNDIRPLVTVGAR